MYMSKVKLIKLKRMAQHQAKCRERGFPVTVQRRAIFDALLDLEDHPTIDQVYENVKERIPGASRTTVFRTLETLAELGVAKITSHFESVARFDGNVDHHHHLICVRCSKVMVFDDSAFTGIPSANTRRRGFEIFDYSVYFEGLCHECETSRAQLKELNRPRKIIKTVK
jgi:Fur family transcriptional regulator, peroxide stress response regulator